MGLHRFRSGQVLTLGGSGTSLIAAERVGRKFRGLDIDPAYVDVAITRWEQLTGKTATLVHRAPEELIA